MEHIALNNGTTVPAAGIGTFLMQPDEAQVAVEAALACGCRLVDTANAYMNEKAVGRALAGAGVAREELYLSTKLWPSVYATADAAVDQTLARLGVSYVDLLFLHQPVGDYVGAYRAMVRAVEAGTVRSLGLSNFSQTQIQEVVDATGVAPAVVQVEAHPYFPQDELKAFLAPFGTKVMAWYPLGHGDRALIEEPLFGRLAAKYGVSNAQVVLRWHTQVGNVVIPGSKNPAHIRENIDLFGFSLTDAELAEVAALNKNTPYYVASDEALKGYLAFAPDFDAQP